MEIYSDYKRWIFEEIDKLKIIQSIYSDHKSWIFEDIDKLKIIRSDVPSLDSYMTSFSVAANRRKSKQKAPPQDYYHHGNKSSYGKSNIPASGIKPTVLPL
ncbi:hypothetical protein ABKV19_015938 [Rosa sericea]